MQRPIRRPGSYRDILALPEHLVGELVEGELIVSPRPAARHALTAGSLLHLLGGPLGPRGGGPGTGWWILPEVELHLLGDVMVPDLAGWRRERVARCPSGAHVDVAPDWVCEVLSPGNAAVDRTRKLPRYAKVGVPHAWLLDPLGRVLEVLANERERWLLLAAHAGEERVRAAPFEEVELDLAALWLPDDP